MATTIVLVIVGLAVAFYIAPVQIGVAVMRGGLSLSGFEKVAVASDRGEVVYFADGDGETLVFLHGLQDHAGGWWQVAPKFTDRFHVVVPDLIGHGESGPAEGPIDPRDALIQLDAVLEREAPGEPVTLIGNSMGGGIALGFALAYPHRVRRLVLVNSAGLKMKLVKRWFLPDSVDDVRETLDRVLGPRMDVPPDFVLRHIKDDVWAGPTPRLWDKFASGEAFLDDLLPGLKPPADIIWGTEDGLIPIEVGRTMHSMIPNSRFHEMPDCGHSPQVDCTAEFNALLATILGDPAVARRPPETQVRF